MDKNTYGKSQAAINLVTLIEEHPNAKVIARKVGRVFQHVNYIMNQLEMISDKHVIERVTTLVLDDIADNKLEFLCNNPGIQNVYILETKIASHTLNVLRGRYRAWKRGERDGITRYDYFDDCTDLYIARTVGGKAYLEVSLKGK